MNPPSIFVTDDDQPFVELIKELLIDVGYPNVVCSMGANAIHRIRDELPALVLLDINIKNPGRGWSTLDSLRRLWRRLGHHLQHRCKLLKVGQRTASGAIHGHPFCRLEPAIRW
jgi:CheY-like chemotaxis protein